jgi:hypothetical protein
MLKIKMKDSLTKLKLIINITHFNQIDDLYDLYLKLLK